MSPPNRERKGFPPLGAARTGNSQLTRGGGRSVSSTVQIMPRQVGDHKGKEPAKFLRELSRSTREVKIAKNLKNVGD